MKQSFPDLLKYVLPKSAGLSAVPRRRALALTPVPAASGAAGAAVPDSPEALDAEESAKAAVLIAATRKRQMIMGGGALVIIVAVWVLFRPKSQEGAYIQSPILTSAPSATAPIEPLPTRPAMSRPVAVVETAKGPEPSVAEPSVVPEVQATNSASATIAVALSDVPLGNEVTMDRVKKAVDERMRPLLAEVDEQQRTISVLEQRIRQILDHQEERRQALGDGELPEHKILFSRYELIDDSVRGIVEARLHYSQTDDDPVFWKMKADEHGREITVEVLDAVITARSPQPVGFLTHLTTRIDGAKRRFVFQSDEQIDADVALSDKYLSIVMSRLDKSAGIGLPAREARPLVAANPESPAFEDTRGTNEIALAKAWKVKSISRYGALLYNTRLNSELSVAMGQDVPYSGRVTDLRVTRHEVVTERDVITKL